MRDFVCSAGSFLRGKCEGRLSVPLASLPEWQRASDDVFVFRDRNENAWVGCVVDHWQEIVSLAEYEAALGILTADSRVAPLIGQHIGTALSTSLLTADQLLRSLVLRSVDPQAMEFDDALFADALNDTLAILWQADVPFLVVAPLMRLRLAAPVALSGELALRVLTDDEISKSLRTHLIRSPFGSQSMVFGLRGVSGLVSTVQMKRRTGDAGLDGFEVANAPISHAIDLVPDVVTALRLFKVGDLVAPGCMTFTLSDLGSGALQWNHFPPAPMPQVDFELDEDECVEFPEFWTRYHGAVRNKVIAAAARRFGFAAQRHRADDRLVDLVVAAEGLFLSEVGASERNELNYRTALRASFYLAPITESNRRDIYSFFRRAYKIRSDIVHGGNPRSADLKGVAGGAVPLDDFVSEFNLLIRAALRHAIETPRARAGIADWDSLILDE